MQALNPRKTALEILCDIESEGAYSNLSLREALEEKAFEAADRRFLTRLVYGVLENRMLIDSQIESHSKTPVRKMKPWILNALRLAVYQMGWLDRVPDSAAINESVKLVKKRFAALSGFTNAVLRGIQRTGINIGAGNGTDLESLSLRYSHPQWIVERWLERYGPDRTENILKADNQTPELSIRVNRLKTDRNTLLVAFEKTGIRARASEYLDEAILIEDLGSQRLSDLGLFRDGHFTMQDISSMLVSKTVAPKDGQKILDLCAAPGGKTTHLAEMMNDRGTVTACDIHPHKIDLILQNTTRLRIQSVGTDVQDGLAFRKAWCETFDHVLVDAPCSGLGIIRKKPEIRYTRKLEDIQNLAELQLNLLQSASRYVKKHGQLIYSTCTIESEENEGVVRLFMERNPSFQLVDINDRLPEPLRSDEPFMNILPDVPGLDGFFTAVLVNMPESE